MIEVEQLTKRFGHFVAVDQLSFNVAPGEVLGFLGPNGAGKSTTMKMITGFLKPTSGRIKVAGFDIGFDGVSARQKIGYLPEGAPLYADMTPRRFLEFIGMARQLSADDIGRGIGRVTELLSLNGVLDKPIETLSKGFRRRVGLAQALLHDPDVLILDEPTDGLDPNQKHQVRALITSLSEEKIVVVSTHILEEVSAVCTRAMIVNQGRIMVDGSPDDLEQQSQYHGAVNLRLDQPVVKEHFSKLSGVKTVQTLDDTGQHLLILPQHKPANLYENALVSAVKDLIEKHSLKVQSLHIERGRLEDVFRQVTTEGAKQVGARSAA